MESNQTDEQLAERIQHGEVQLFEILVNRYHQRLLRYGTKILFNRTDLEDIIQEVFLKAFKNFQSFDPSRKFSAWIYRIAHNELINHGKKLSRQIIDYFDFDIFLPQISTKDRPESNFDNEQLKQMLEKNLSTLEPKYREPLVLYYFEDLDYKEISDILRIPVNTVGVRILRAKNMLKKLLLITNVPKHRT